MKPRAVRRTKQALRRSIVSTLLLASLAAGCRAGAALDTPTPLETDTVRATPYAQQPAAGICAEAESEEAVMRLLPGIPDPRCVIVRPDQRLRVVNETGADVNISLGPFALPLPSDGETVFGPTFGEYLLPGVHVLSVDPCCGGELWLRSNAE
jgi:hypothetical protein